MGWKRKDWWRLRQRRLDTTDYVIHWIKEKGTGEKRVSPFDILLEILKCGYLKPTFAIMSPLLYEHSPRPTIRGPYPAVCFTEQTLECFIQSYECPVVRRRYWPYGIALHKWALFEYGGRPVIYHDESILGTLLTSIESGFEEGKGVYGGGLPEEFQYLWVRYSPIPSPEGYPIDHTHEREWRAKVKAPYHALEGALPEEGIPLFLPPVYVAGEWKRYYPHILVKTREEREALARRVQECWTDWREECQNEYLEKQFGGYPKMTIIALEEVKEHLEAGEREEWARLETLPSESSTMYF